MNKYKVTLEVQGNIEIDEPIEANSYDEAVDIAIKEYGNESWYEFYGDAELIDDSENPYAYDEYVDQKMEEEYRKSLE